MANKCDLTERSEVSAAEGEEFGKAHHLEFFETSAVSSEPFSPDL